MPQLFEIARTIRRPEDLTKGRRGGAAHRSSPPITEGLTPRLPKLEFGIMELEPEELLAINVPTLSLNGTIEGYQRVAQDKHVRQIAREMLAGKPMPAGTVGIDENGIPHYTDCQHRALAAVMVRLRLRVDIRPLTMAEQRALFAGQRQARAVPKSVLVLAGADPISSYVQDVFTSPDTPWLGLISEHGSGGRFSPAGLAQAAGVYGADSIGNNGASAEAEARFSPAAADELARLFRAFGTPETNRAAFEHVARRAITQAALVIIGRRGRQMKDIQRWMRHMPKFNFEDYHHIRTSKRLREELVNHWNKRLSDDQRVRA